MILSWLIPILFAILVWYGSTGAILWLDRRAATFRPAILMAATGAALLALVSLMWVKDATGLGAAYIGFAAAVVIWGWIEMLFLAGVVTGPRRLACPPDPGPWRFFYATAAVIHHELALFVLGLGLAILLWEAPNATALWTFLVLWSMRLSAKVNLYLGVPNFSAELLPERMHYLASYFRSGPMSWFFPLSVTLASAACGGLAVAAALTGIETVAGTGLALAATLMGLAILEHWFMILPIPDSALWKWATRDAAHREKAGTTTPQDLTAAL